MKLIRGMQDRFILEPRCNYSCGCKWLVAYDIIKEKYVKMSGSNRKYARFRNSQIAFRELEERTRKGEI